MTLSVVIADTSKIDRLNLTPELAGIDYEIVDSLEDAEGDYVTIVGSQAGYSPGFFFRNLHVFLAKPKFKKLAMVAPVISDGTENVYGYTHNADGLYPVYNPASRNPYLVQTAAIQGAIIRRSAIKGHETLSGTLSQGVCIGIWERGMRIMLNPQTVYRTNTIVHPEMFSEPSESIIMEWKREAI